MGLFTRKRSQTLSEEFVVRFWDLKAQVDALETRVEDALEQVERKRQRIEQAERRRDQREKGNGQLELANPAQEAFEKIRRLQRGPS